MPERGAGGPSGFRAAHGPGYMGLAGPPCALQDPYCRQMTTQSPSHGRRKGFGKSHIRENVR